MVRSILWLLKNLPKFLSGMIFYPGQLQDLQKAREDLIEITSEIRKESAHMFHTTYVEIRKNFHLMFRRLFGGGRAELKLVDPDNILTSGIENLCPASG